MFDGFKRGFLFGKIADALDALARGEGGGKVLGWDMGSWKVWLEGAGWAAVAAVAGAFVDAQQSGQPFSLQSFKATALVAALSAIATYVRKSPTDPRRSTSSPTEGQLIDMASRVKEEPKP